MTSSPFVQLLSHDSQWLALLIFAARVVDVSLGTIRNPDLNAQRMPLLPRSWRFAPKKK